MVNGWEGRRGLGCGAGKLSTEGGLTGVLGKVKLRNMVFAIQYRIPISCCWEVVRKEII